MITLDGMCGLLNYLLTHIVDQARIIYLLEDAQAEKQQTSLSTIRCVDTKCRICGKRFELVNPQLGYICPDHLSKPYRYMLDVSYDDAGVSKRAKLYSNQYREVLKGYQQARDLQADVEHDKLAGKFDPKKYKKSKKEDPKIYHLQNCWAYYKDTLTNAATLVSVELAQKHTVRFFTTSEDIRKFTQQDIEALNEELKKTMTANSAKTLISYLLACIRYCERKLKMTSLGLKIPKIPPRQKPKKTKTPGRDEARQIVNAIRNAHYRWAAQINQIQGIRPSEVVCIKIGNINFKTGKIEVRNHEIRNHEIGPGTKSQPEGFDSLINASLIDPLRKYCEDKDPDEWLCPAPDGKRMRATNLEEHIRSATRKLGQQFTPYAVVKHSTLSHVASITGNAFGIAAISGITPETAMRNYIRPTNDDTAAKAVQNTITLDPGDIQPPND